MAVHAPEIFAAKISAEPADLSLPAMPFELSQQSLGLEVLSACVRLHTQDLAQAALVVEKGVAIRNCVGR